MTNKFYRTKKTCLKTWNEILTGMHEDLITLAKGDVDEAEARTYLNDLLSQALPARHDQDMLFLCFDLPENLPGDARVDYLYSPTYLAAAIAMGILNRFPEIADGEYLSGSGSMATDTAMRILSGVMLACTQRGFSGHGYDAMSGKLDALEIFIKADALRFIAKHPALCPEFNRCFLRAFDECRTAYDRGQLVGMWGEDYTERFSELLKCDGANLSRFDPCNLAKAFGPDADYVFVYGTLMRGQAAAEKMSGALFLGDALLDGYTMYDLGAYPGIVPAGGDRVFGQMYLADAALMAELDVYECVGELYRRETASVTVAGLALRAQVYVYIKPVSKRVESGCWCVPENDNT